MSAEVGAGTAASAAGRHLRALGQAIPRLAPELPRLERWGRHLAAVLADGGRLMAAGNGGSAAEAQHLTSELVGRYRSDRRPLSAIALHAESSSVTAVANDFGYEEAFRRPVLAHGRPGDVLVALSTSGRSGNVLAAVEAARAIGADVWALTGRAPNPLAAAAHDALAVPCDDAAVVQELHLVAVHLLCEVLDEELAARPSPRRGSARQAVTAGGRR